MVPHAKASFITVPADDPSCPYSPSSGSGTLTVSRIPSVPDIAFQVTVNRCGPEKLQIETSAPKTELRMTVGSTHLVLKNIHLKYRKEAYGTYL
jgi:hypothetical protein